MGVHYVVTLNVQPVNSGQSGLRIKVDENSLAGFPVLKKTVYLFVYIGLVVGRLIFRRCILLEGKQH